MTRGPGQSRSWRGSYRDLDQEAEAKGWDRKQASRLEQKMKNQPKGGIAAKLNFYTKKRLVKAYKVDRKPPITMAFAGSQIKACTLICFLLFLNRSIKCEALHSHFFDIPLPLAVFPLLFPEIPGAMEGYPGLFGRGIGIHLGPLSRWLSTIVVPARFHLALGSPAEDCWRLLLHAWAFTRAWGERAFSTTVPKIHYIGDLDCPLDHCFCLKSYLFKSSFYLIWLFFCSVLLCFSCTTYSILCF